MTSVNCVSVIAVDFKLLILPIDIQVEIFVFPLFVSGNNDSFTEMSCTRFSCPFPDSMIPQ